MDAPSPTNVVANFGGNVVFSPSTLHAPRSEAELLEILRAHPRRKIRAVGRLHSWSEAPVCPEALVDLRHLDTVTIRADEDSPWAEVGAGCQIKRLLTELAQQGYTMPSLGVITEQSLGGAIATGTHGSGRHSLSHYVQSVRLASYDPVTREPIIRTIDSGNELRAARCSLGSLGLITSVRIPIRPRYLVEEHLRRHDQLEAVLAAEEAFDLQQFFLIPWRWDFFAQHRREVDRPRSRLAPLYRLYWSVGMDVLFHLGVRVLARWLPGFCTNAYYRWMMPALVPRKWKVVDQSDRQLTMRHQLFQHIEIEVFVTRSRLAEAVKYVEWLLEHLGGKTAPLDDSLKRQLQSRGDWERLRQHQGSYRHHYPICIRKVLPDDTLISMASGGDEPRYALSFISYAHPRRRDGFFAFAELLARTMATLFEARPHWGKVCPIDATEIERLYPEFDTFRQVAHALDPEGFFGNLWTTRLLGHREVKSAIPSHSVEP